jgi:hypothetical protein
MAANLARLAKQHTQLHAKSHAAESGFLLSLIHHTAVRAGQHVKCHVPRYVATAKTGTAAAHICSQQAM